jgi:hypothetical protein
MPEQACGQYAAVVYYQQIVSAKKFWKIPKSPIFPSFSLALQVQHARIRAVCERLFGD